MLQYLENIFRMTISINKIIILLIITTYAASKLVIVNPPALKKYFTDKYG